MLKQSISLIIVLLLTVGCSSKKRGLPLWFLILGGGGTTDSIPASGTTIDNANNGGSFVVAPIDQNLPDNSSNTGGGSNSGSQDPITTIISNITYQILNDAFLWDNTITTNITIRVSNEDGPLAGISVKISEDQSNPGITQTLNQGLTGSNGVINLQITVNPSVNEIILTIVGINPKTGQLQEISGRIPIQIPNPNSGGNGTGGGTVVIAPDVDLDTGNFDSPNGCLTNIDSDCDGIADADDDFPNDPTLGWTLNSGRATLAWEDYYQSSHIVNGTVNPNNDMDLNDHVTVFQTAQNFTPQGKVATISGVFTHVGKGAGFNHDLRLSLDVPVGAQLEITYTGNNGQVIPTMNCGLAVSAFAKPSDCVGGAVSKEDLKAGILILPNSSHTLYGAKNAPNVGGTLNYVLGMTASFTIRFNEPVDLTQGKNLSGGHLNYYLAVSGTGEKIFRPGFYQLSNGEDRYIDRVSGFPFGVIVPGVFNFPRERVNILDPSNQGKTGYPAFKEWASSRGTLSRQWYEQVMDANLKQYVVDLKVNYQSHPFTAYILGAVHNYLWSISTGLIAFGSLLGLGIRAWFLSKK